MSHGSLTTSLTLSLIIQVLASLILKYHAETENSAIRDNLLTQAGEWRAATICTGTAALLGCVSFGLDL